MHVLVLGKLGKAVTVALFLIAVGIVFAWYSGTRTAKSFTGGLPPVAAVEKALILAKGGGVAGPAFTGLVGEPSSAAGAIVSLDTAVRIQTGASIDRGTQEWANRNDMVWVIVFNGNVDATRVVNSQVEAPIVKYRQIMVIMHAGTGEIISRSVHPIGQERDLNALESLDRFLTLSTER